MKISTILSESHKQQSLRILAESCDGLDHKQRLVVEGIYNELKPLIEASLDPNQIKQLFGSVEKSATAAGGNRTTLGKGVDVAKKANEIINKLGSKLQDTAPVKAFDAKFEKLKADINKKFPDSKILDGISNLAIWVEKNPGKSAAVIGILTAIASLAAGPIGGAIAGQVLRGSVELLKGEKLSTAIGKGVKTAVFGFLTGKAFEMLGEFAEGIRIKSIPFGPENAGYEQVSFGASKTISSPGMEWTRQIQGVDIIVDPEMASAVRSAENLLRMGGDAANEGFEQLDNIAKIINSAEYKKEIMDTLEVSRQELLKNDSLLNFIKSAKEGLQAASQGAVAAAGVKSSLDKKESREYQLKPLSEGQVYMIFNRVSRVELTEAPMDLVRGAVGKIKQAGTNLTTKVTADKLNKAWQAAGSPTDSDQLADFLTKQGVDAEIVKSVYADMKLPAPGTAKQAQDFEAVKQMIMKLPTDRKARLLKSLTKTAPLAQPTAQGTVQ